MKKLAAAIATGALMLTLAAPAEAAVTHRSEPQASHQRFRDRRFHECYTPHRRWARGDCYDDRRAQHDGRGSILF